MRWPALLLGWVVCAAACAQGATVWVASPWEHVLRDSPPGAASVAEITSAANEYEPFRIIVTAGAEALADVTAEAGALTGPGATIGAENVALFREHYIEVTKPSYASTAPTGWYPDALVPCTTEAAPADAKYIGLPFSVEPGLNYCDYVRLARDRHEVHHDLGAAEFIQAENLPAYALARPRPLNVAHRRNCRLDLFANFLLVHGWRV